MKRHYPEAYLDQLVLADVPSVTDEPGAPKIYYGALVVIGSMLGVVEEVEENGGLYLNALEPLPLGQYSNQVDDNARQFTAGQLEHPGEQVLLSQYTCDEFGPVQCWVDAKSRH